MGALLICALSVGLNYYVGSRGALEQLEARAQGVLGLPVKIGGMHYNLWSGLKVNDITVRDEASGSSISLPMVSAQMAFGPLLSGRFVLRHLVVNELSLVLVQSADGGWQFPPSKPAKEFVKVPQKPEEHGASKGFKPEFSIQLVKLESARLRFVEKSGKDLAVLEGVTGRVALENPGKALGNIAVQKVILSNGVVIEAFRTPFTWEGNRLALSPMDARLAEGSIGGEATVGTASGQPPFTLDLHFDGVNIERLMKELGEDKNRRMGGILLGNLDLYGVVGQKKNIGGAGYIRMRGAKMEQIPLVQMISGVLQMQENDVELKQAQLDLRVGEEKVFVDSLVLESSSMSLSAKGTSAFDGKLNLAARLALNPRVSRQLPGWVDANFQPVSGSDWRDIGFAVTGTLARPHTDLPQVMVGQKLGNQFMNLLQSITGKQKKKSSDKKKPEPEVSGAQEEEGAAQPGATP